MYFHHHRCRACGFGPPILPGGTKAGPSHDKLIPVFSLGVQPLANDFCTPDEEHSGFAPLEVVLCPQCGLAQLSVVVRPDILYRRDYPYVTSKSGMMKDHFAKLWWDAAALAKTKTVLEIGSNDGDFLAFCRDNGAEAVVGIEPAPNLAAAARKKGIETVCEFFGPESASIATQTVPQIGMIFARHVFCHAPDWGAFMANLQILAGPDTVIFIEAPYVKDQIESNSFDQVYHEHASYLSIRAIKALLNGGPFEIRKVTHYDIHGGAIVLAIQRRSPDVQPDPSVSQYLEAENITVETWKAFRERSLNLISNLGSTIIRLSETGKRVAGYGASAKSTVWINAMGLTRKHLACVYDCTPEKWYRLIPGTDIPIAHEGGFYADGPDYAVLFSWNFAKEIIAKNRKWLEGGGQFIVPVPEVRFIGLDGIKGEA